MNTEIKRERYTLLDRLIIPDYDTTRGVQGGSLVFDGEKCRECGICIQLCPGGCLYTERAEKTDLLSGGVRGGKYGVPMVARTQKGTTLCVACFDCGAACPHGAISIVHNFSPTRFFKRLTQTGEMLYPRRY